MAIEMHGVTSRVVQTSPGGRPLSPHQLKSCGRVLRLTRPSLLDWSTHLGSFLKCIAFWVRDSGLSSMRPINNMRYILRGCRPQAMPRPGRFWPSLPQGITSPLIACSPPTIPPLAPTLHSCMRVIGDTFIVVSRCILKSEGGCLRNTSLRLNLEVVRKDVSQALRLLHDHDLVFGDLREANPLYLSNDRGRILLVDFDGVGRHGIDRNSACFNPGAGLGVDRVADHG